MEVIHGKLTKKILDGEYESVYWLIIRRGEECRAVYYGSTPPQAYKTVEYVLSGQFVDHPIFGLQFLFENWHRPPGKAAEMKIVESARRALDLGLKEDIPY